MGTTRFCSIPGCGQPHKARGWCTKHWQRWKNQGDPLTRHTRWSSMTPEQRFWTNVDKNGPLPAAETLAVGKGPCWLWKGSLRTAGYGGYSFSGKQYQAHRLSYTWLVGPVPDGLILDHLCALRACVNPDHLEPVTFSENTLRGAQLAKRQNRRWGTTGHCRIDQEVPDAQ